MHRLRSSGWGRGGARAGCRLAHALWRRRAPQALPRPPRTARGSCGEAGPRSPEETLRRARPFLSSLRLGPCSRRGEFLRRPGSIGRHPGRGAAVAGLRPRGGEAEAVLVLPAACLTIVRGLSGGTQLWDRGTPLTRTGVPMAAEGGAELGGHVWREAPWPGVRRPPGCDRFAADPFTLTCPPPGSKRYLWGGVSGEHSVL